MKLKKDPKKTVIITDQWFNPNDPTDIQTLHSSSNEDRYVSIEHFVAESGPDLGVYVFKIPFGTVAKVNYTIGRYITTREFYRQHHPEYWDEKNGLTGVRGLIEEWLLGKNNNPVGHIPDDLQNLWLIEKGVWPK